jgi:hypothetical protein
MFVGRFGPMSPCLLLDLPEALARRILQEWLHWKYVVRLDSVFSSHETREQFTAVACGPHRIFTTDPGRGYGDFKPIIQWAMSRCVRLDGFCIYKDCSRDDELLQNFLRKCGSVVRWIRCCNLYSSSSHCQEVLIEAAKSCPHVRDLVIKDFDQEFNWDECIVTATKAFPELINLSVYPAVLSTQGFAEALSRCKVLESISLFIHVENGQVIPVAIAIPTLKSIRIDSKHVSDDVLVGIGQKCAKLEVFPMFSGLYRHTHQATDVGIRAVLQGCPLLRDTDVEQAFGFGLDVRVELARRRNLKVISLMSWHDMSEGLLQEVLKVSPNLTTFRNRNSYCVTDTMLAVCGQHCPLLVTLDLGVCSGVTNDGIRALVSSLAGKLRVAKLQECTGLYSPAVLAIAEHCPQLEELDCPHHVSTSAMLKLAECCPQLTHLKMSGSKVGDEVVTALAAHCPRLKVLYMGGCRSVTMQGVRAVVEGCPQLQELLLPAHLKKHPLPQRVQVGTALKVFYADKKGR